MMILKQFNTMQPQVFEANRTQVNINITPTSRSTMEGEIEGYEYTTVIFENSEIYSDEALIELANKKVAQEYLKNTDWYVIRLADTGIEIPQDVKAKREEARSLL